MYTYDEKLRAINLYFKYESYAAVLMVGATLAGAFELTAIFWIVMFSMIVLQWTGNAIQGHIGAKTGRPSSVIVKNSLAVFKPELLLEEQSF